MIHVAICDTHPVAIEGLVSLLDSTDSFRVVAAAGCLEGVLHAASYASAGLLILDKALGQQKLLDVIRELRKRGSDLRVVVWGSAVAESEALHYLRAGAAGVARKTASLEALLRCLHGVALGGAWMDDTPVGDGVQRRVAEPPLSARELQVMDLVERGLTNRQIAQELEIRPGTVKIHLRNVSRKTGARRGFGRVETGLGERPALTPVRIM